MNGGEESYGTQPDVESEHESENPGSAHKGRGTTVARRLIVDTPTKATSFGTALRLDSDSDQESLDLAPPPVRSALSAAAARLTEGLSPRTARGTS